MLSALHLDLSGTDIDESRRPFLQVAAMGEPADGRFHMSVSDRSFHLVEGTEEIGCIAADGSVVQVIACSRLDDMARLHENDAVAG